MAAVDHEGFGFQIQVGRGVDPWGAQVIDWVMDHGWQQCSVCVKQWWRGREGEKKKQKEK